MEGHIDPQETEEQKEERHAEQRLALELIDLKKDQPEIYLKYHNFLLQEKLELAKKNEGRPVKIPIETKQQILGRARSTVINGADPVKVLKDFNAYTSKDGRPPIGGAQDD
jgi:hypothetical protein